MFSYKTRIKDIHLELLNRCYIVSEYSAIDGKVTFNLACPQKIVKLQDELEHSENIEPRNEMTAKTRDDIVRAIRAELILLQSGIHVTYENEEIEICSPIESNMDSDLTTEYFKIYIADILSSQGVGQNG